MREAAKRTGSIGGREWGGKFREHATHFLPRGDGSDSLTGMDDDPSAIQLPHRVPLGHAGTPSAAFQNGLPVYFLTLCARERSTAPFLSIAPALLDAAQKAHENGKWFLRLFLVMPDHLHILASFPPTSSLAVVVGVWKQFVAKSLHVRWQRNFFDHRIRSENEYAEKWAYIRMNPVRKGLVASADDWPHWTGYDSAGRHLR